MILPTQFVKSQNFYLHIWVKYRNFADEIRKEDRFGCLQPLKNNAKTRNHERPLIIKTALKTMNANILLEAESHSLPVSAMRKQAVVFTTLLLKPQNGILI